MPEKRTLYTRNVWLTASLLVAVAAVFLVYTALERRVDNAGEARFVSMQLADELRQSSEKPFLVTTQSFVMSGWN